MKETYTEYDSLTDCLVIHTIQDGPDEEIVILPNDQVISELVNSD